MNYFRGVCVCVCVGGERGGGGGGGIRNLVFFTREMALVNALEREALWRLVVDKKHGTIGVVF